MRFKVGDLQAGALQVYVFDPAHEEEPFPGTLAGKVLTVDDGKVYEALDLLSHAQNSADGDRWPEYREALNRVWWRIAKKWEKQKKEAKR